MPRMKIAIVVHGRFEAFDMARELIRRGHDVTLLTNYPRWAVERFGVPARHVRSFWVHGVLSRAAAKFGLEGRLEPQLHEMFGRWAAAALRGQQWDVMYAFSGVGEECLRALEGTPTLRLLVRASAHVRTQDRLLREEELRTGSRLDRPSPWRLCREEREYEQADHIRVLSSFAKRTFLDESIPDAKVRVILSGANLERFRAAPIDVDRRRRRLLGGEPLRVLCIGSFSFRKGVWDTSTAIRELGPEAFTFRFVGPILTEAAGLAKQLRTAAEFVPKQAEASLPSQYAWGDLFVLPTIEDGYQSVLVQAAAAAVPIITTPNGAGHDLVHEDQNGWIIPIRSPGALVDRLRWAYNHRSEVAEVVRESYEQFQPRDSARVAADFEEFCSANLSARRMRPSRGGV
jgi:glycosyltransferase involved in cell wall biosynthesis